MPIIQIFATPFLPLFRMPIIHKVTFVASKYSETLDRRKIHLLAKQTTKKATGEGVRCRLSDAEVRLSLFL